jgi:hypothetical protein
MLKLPQLDQVQPLTAYLDDLGAHWIGYSFEARKDWADIC